MRSLTAVLISLALLPACNEKKSEVPVPVATATTPTATAKPKSAHGMMGNMGNAQPGGADLKGKVLEKIDAASYSYLRIQGADGEMWAAVTQSPVEVGTEVAIVGGMRMDGFESKALKRKFDKIVFGELSDGKAAAPAGAMAGELPPGHPPMGDQAAAAPGVMPAGHPPIAGPADMGEVKVKKAAGADGKTVAELFAQKATLKDAKVTVHGKVVKVANGIMGKNWMHVRDGSGAEASKDNDLTVTTLDTAVVGDVVTVSGVVHVDKDFGAGYAYGVIVEEAKVAK